MKDVKSIKAFLNDDQILDCLILFEDRKMDASRKLQGYLSGKYNVSVLAACNILTTIKNELDAPKNR